MSNDYLGREIDTAAIRESFKDTKGRDLAISDEVLANIIVAAGKRWTDFEDADDPEKVACDFLEKAEAEVAKVSVSDPGITVLVNKMDKEFHDAVADDIEAVVKGKATAVHIYAHFKRIYSLEELNSMPVPGTEIEHLNGSNSKRPDKTKTKDQTGKPITITWSNDFVSAMPEGKQFESLLDDLSKEAKAPGSVPSLKGKSKSDLAALKSDATQRRNALRSMVKRAISLHHQWVAVEGMPKVGLRWIKGTKDKGMSMPKAFGEGEFGEGSQTITMSPKPIWMYPSTEPSEGRDFSVTQFLAFDVDMATANGGTMADLVATAGRGSDDQGEGDGDGTDLPIEDAVTDMSLLVNFFNKNDNKLTILRRISNRAADPEGNDILENVGTLYLLLKPIYEKNKAAYEEVIQRDRTKVA